MKRHIGVLLIFVILFAAFTFPLVAKFNTHIPGFFSTDESYGALWDFWRRKDAYAHKVSLRTTDIIAYPFGMDLLSNWLPLYIGPALNYLLAILVSPACAWNLQVAVNLILSGFMAYLLVLYVTRSRPAAIFSGIAFAFCPYQFVRAWQHLGLTYNEWIPLTLLMALVTYEAFSKERAGWYLLSIILLASFDYSIAYMGMITLGFFLVYVVFFHWRKKFFGDRKQLAGDFAYLRKSMLVVLLAGIILTPQWIALVKNRAAMAPGSAASANNPYHRPLEDLFTQSSRSLSYLLPASSHPVFGGFTEQFIGSSLYGDSFTEHTLFLGWTVLFLAFWMIGRWLFRKKELSAPDRFSMGFFIFLAVAAWLFSQPPWWQFWSWKVTMPSYVLYKILPMFRAYARFGIVVMLGVSVLAGFGLKHLLGKIKQRWLRPLVTCGFCGLVLFEFWNWPPYKVIDVSRAPAVYSWLNEQAGSFAIAEYPLDADSPNEMYKFYQITHHKKMVNGTREGTPARTAAQAIRNLADPRTPGFLEKMGVRYCLVHRDDYQATGKTADTEELNRIPLNPGLTFVKSFPEETCPQEDIACAWASGPVDVYIVIAAPLISGKPQVN